jgi:hypothetical protein
MDWSTISFDFEEQSINYIIGKARLRKVFKSKTNQNETELAILYHILNYILSLDCNEIVKVYVSISFKNNDTDSSRFFKS